MVRTLRLHDSSFVKDRFVRTFVVVVALAMVSACRNPLSVPVTDALGTGPAGPDVDSPSMPRDDTPHIEGPPPPLPSHLRLLNGDEYRNAVWHLLGVEAGPHIAHVHLSGGFDTGAEGQLHEALLDTLIDDAHRVAELAVSTSLVERYSCVGFALDSACVHAVLTDLAPRAARRPVTQERLDELLGFFEAQREQENDASAALVDVLLRLLLSPDFLYRREVGEVLDGERKLDAFEQANLVSFSLTASPPDVDLIAAAQQATQLGRRLGVDELRTHARRLLATTAGRGRVATLVRHWVHAGALDDMVVRPEDFPKLSSAAQARALRDGFDRFVVDVAYGSDGTLGALFDSSFAMVNRHTAGLLGVDVGDVEDLVRVELSRQERRGLLTQPGLLAALGASGDADRDRPVLRGLMVKTQLLCESVGPPSAVNTAAAANAAASVPGFAAMTTRQQYEAMMEQSASCQACHAEFMPLGFAWGRYDALGRYRTEQRGQPVDAAIEDVPFFGSYADFDDGLMLSDALVSAPQVADCFARQTAAFVSGLGSAPEARELGAFVARARFGEAHILATLESTVVQAALAPRHLLLEEQGDDGDGDGDDTGDGTEEDDEQGVVQDPELLLSSGVELRPGERRLAHGGRFDFVYQGDGNLVLYQEGVARWASRTNGDPAYLTAMQGDGNLVVYAALGEPIFHTRTHGSPGAALYVRADAALEVRGPDGSVLKTLLPNLGAP
jgi:hypothetical protein